MRHAPKRLHFPVAAFLLLSLSLGLSGCGRSTSPTSLAPATRLQPGTQTQFVYGWQGVPVVAGEAIVELKEGEDLQDFATANNLQVVATLSFGEKSIARVRSTVEPNSAVLDLALEPKDETVWAVPNMMIGNPMSEDDGGPMQEGGDFENQYAVSLLDMAGAHELATGAGVRVAVLDTGLDPWHVVFNPLGSPMVINGLSHLGDSPTSWTTEVAAGIDTDLDTNVDEAFGHGTHVSGIIRLAAPGAVIVAIQVLDSDGKGTTWGACEGIREAVAVHDAQVINMSFRIECASTPLDLAVQWAHSRGAVMVASAGSLGTTAEQWPASYREVISVTSTDDHDQLWEEATRNSAVDLSAPGVDIVSAVPASAGLGVYARASGGSMATAWVSAAAALILELGPNKPPSEVMALLQDGSLSVADVNPGLDGLMGSGRVRLRRPLELMEGHLVDRRISAR